MRPEPRLLSDAELELAESSDLEDERPFDPVYGRAATAAEIAATPTPGPLRIVADAPAPEPDPAGDAWVAAGIASDTPLGDWPDAPSEAAYHGLAGEIVETIARVSEADRVALLVTLLTCFGALANGRSTHRGSWHAPNLFAVLVGDSATSRKGTSFSNVRGVFRRAQGELLDEITVPGVGSGEGLIGHLRRGAEKGEIRALVLETELSRLLAVMAREGSSLSMTIRDAWDGAKLGRFLAREDQSVSRHHVALLGHTTPTELRARLTEIDMANGFANRMLFFAVRRTRLEPEAPDPAPLCTPYVDDLHWAIVGGSESGILDFTPAATDRWEAFYARHAARRAYGLTAALTARGDAHVVRLALTHALLDRSSAIDEPHLDAAIALWEYAERSARHIFGDSTGNRHADVLRRVLRDRGGISRKEIRDVLGLRMAADVDEVIAVLTGYGLAELTRAAGSSRGGPRAEILVATDAT